VQVVREQSLAIIESNVAYYKANFKIAMKLNDLKAALFCFAF
jgi:hypothetical protein